MSLFNYDDQSNIYNTVNLTSKWRICALRVTVFLYFVKIENYSWKTKKKIRLSDLVVAVIVKARGSIDRKIILKYLEIPKHKSI